VGWVGDTSLSYGIGMIISKQWGRFLLSKNPTREGKGNPIAWLETVAIRLQLIMLLKIGVSPGRLCMVQTDNTTTYSTARQRKC
jgi:hypothetical protein